MNVSGTWKGEYTFEETEGAKGVAGHVVPFTLTLKQGWLGMISGTVQDDTRAGFPEAGTVKGRLKKRTLGFRRHHPVFRLMHESSRITLEQWADRHKVVVDLVRAHPAILHMGDLSEDGRTLKGRWRMPPLKVEIPGSYLTLDMPAVGGTWTVSRAG